MAIRCDPAEGADCGDPPSMGVHESRSLLAPVLIRNQFERKSGSKQYALLIRGDSALLGVSCLTLAHLLASSSPVQENGFSIRKLGFKSRCERHFMMFEGCEARPWLFGPQEPRTAGGLQCSFRLTNPVDPLSSFSTDGPVQIGRC